MDEMDEFFGMKNDYDIADEIAQNAVPSYNYTAANAYAQLGLYYYEDVGYGTYNPENYVGGSRSSGPIKMMRYTLYAFAYNYVLAVGIERAEE
jgi:hypothetical protein